MKPLVLFASAILAMGLANSRFSSFYNEIIQSSIFARPTHWWINDVLMSVFFFLIGMEVKYELIEGALNSAQKALLPIVAAAGGMTVPAVLFLLINAFFAVHGADEFAHGWGVPIATDIAFALGVLGLLGQRIHPSLKVFLLTLAVVDDLGAVAVIGIFYSSSIHLYALACAVGCLALIAGLLFALRGRGHWLSRSCMTLAVITGLGFWIFIDCSGLHPTVAGCVLGFMVPRESLMPLSRKIGPWTNGIIMPVFAFANAGLSFSALSSSANKGIFLQPLVLSIALALFLGKPMGIFSFSWLALKLRWAELPTGMNLFGLFGVGVLGGIGFTMAIFIASLAFLNPSILDFAKLGIVLGSLFSAALGLILLRIFSGAVVKNNRPSR
jgi:NhaA family Na+:H+ antiporter